MDVPFAIGQKVRVRPEFRRPDDFEEAVVSEVDPDDGTIDVDIDGKDWGQWFTPLPDGSYEIEPA